MRIAFVNDTFLEGRGADTVIYELAKRLGKKHEVYVLAGKTDIKEENFKFLSLNLNKLYTGQIKDFNFLYKMIKLRKEIENIQKQYKFDIFNVFHSALNPSFRGYPSVVTWLGSPNTKNFFRKAVNKMMLMTLENGKVIVISRYLEKRLPSKDVRMIYCGISKEFKPLKNKDKEYMLYVGRLEKHKGIESIIGLSKQLNFPLKIAGYGTEEEKLKKMKDRISAPVEFIGRVSRQELIKLYRECSFFVSASRWEGFGLIFLEAGACRKPSIGYNIGAIPEVIIDGKTGFLVNSQEELKQRTEELIKNKILRERMGKEALRFSKKFDWDKTAEAYENAYQEIKNGF